MQTNTIKMPAERATFVAMTAATTEKEMRDIVRRFGPPVIDGKMAPLRVTVGGYDDSREVWFQPEVVQMFRRLIDTGFVSIMACDSNPDPNVYGVDAVTVCACVMGLLQPPAQPKAGVVAVLEISRRQWATIMETIGQANEACDAEIATVPQ